jgi:hypothetical protein
MSGGDIFGPGDPFDLPEWRQAELMAGAPPKPAKGYLTCSLAWLGRVRPLMRSAEQLMVLELIYRRCLIERSRTVTLPNKDLGAVGMSKYGKCRMLDALERAGLIAREPWNGKAVRVTLLDFP